MCLSLWHATIPVHPSCACETCAGWNLSSNLRLPCRMLRTPPHGTVLYVTRTCWGIIRASCSSLDARWLCTGAWTWKRRPPQGTSQGFPSCEWCAIKALLFSGCSSLHVCMVDEMTHTYVCVCACGWVGCVVCCVARADARASPSARGSLAADVMASSRPSGQQRLCVAIHGIRCLHCASFHAALFHS